jgi:hypothetical protein
MGTTFFKLFPFISSKLLHLQRQATVIWLAVLARISCFHIHHLLLQPLAFGFCLLQHHLLAVPSVFHFGLPSRTEHPSDTVRCTSFEINGQTT